MITYIILTASNKSNNKQQTTANILYLLCIILSCIVLYITFATYLTTCLIIHYSTRDFVTCILIFYCNFCVFYVPVFSSKGFWLPITSQCFFFQENGQEWSQVLCINISKVTTGFFQYISITNRFAAKMSPCLGVEC